MGSASAFTLARDIDPAYGRAFDAARSAGVEALAYRCRIELVDGGHELRIADRIPMLD